MAHRPTGRSSHCVKSPPSTSPGIQSGTYVTALHNLIATFSLSTPNTYLTSEHDEKWYIEIIYPPYLNLDYKGLAVNSS